MKICLFFSLIALACSAAGQERSKLKSKIQVLVSADENIQSEITSFIDRELRELGDVTIVDDKPNWEIRILALEPQFQDGRRAPGLSISVVILYHYNNDVAYDTLFDERHAQLAKEMTRGLVLCADHKLLIAPAGELKQACQKIVAVFDSEHLDKVRKGVEKAIKAFEEQTKK